MTAHVLQTRLEYEQRPELTAVPGVMLRTFAGEGDIDAWLEIRNRAFAREKIGVRQWGRADFEQEFLAKAWWSPGSMWFGVAEADARFPSSIPVGTVTLAMRGSGPEARPVVHWLAVLPAWRRRGIGRLLLSRLHQACWDAGQRQIWLETHVGWQAAGRLYRALGYQEARANPTEMPDAG